MAIARDANAVIGSWSSASTTTGSHTCTGSDRLLVVAVFTNSAVTACTASYNGVSMTALPSSPAVDTDGNKNYFFYLANPATGSNTVSVTRTGGSNMSIVSASYTGVDQTTPIDDSSSASGGTSPSYTPANLTVSDADNWFVSAWRDNSNTVSSSDMSQVVASGVVPEEIWDTNGTIGATGGQSVTYSITSGKLMGHSFACLSAATAGSASSSPSPSASSSPSPSVSSSPSESASPSSSPSPSVSSSPSPSVSSSPSQSVSSSPSPSVSSSVSSSPSESASPSSSPSSGSSVSSSPSASSSPSPSVSSSPSPSVSASISSSPSPSISSSPSPSPSPSISSSASSSPSPSPSPFIWTPVRKSSY